VKTRTIETCRGINESKKGCHLRPILIKDENYDPFGVCHNILYKWKNYFAPIPNVRRTADVRQIEIHSAEPILPEHSPYYFEADIGKLKKILIAG
jgi:hypothetical protein